MAPGARPIPPVSQSHGGAPLSQRSAVHGPPSPLTPLSGTPSHPLQLASWPAHSFAVGSTSEPPRQGWAQGPPPCSYRVTFPGEPLPVPDLRSTIPARSPLIHIKGVLSLEHPPVTVLSGQNRNSAPRLPFSPTTFKQSIKDCRRRDAAAPPLPGAPRSAMGTLPSSMGIAPVSSRRALPQGPLVHCGRLVGAGAALPVHTGCGCRCEVADVRHGPLGSRCFLGASRIVGE